MQNLTEKQIEAVNAIDDDVEIIACAGAGKTGVVQEELSTFSSVNLMYRRKTL